MPSAKEILGATPVRALLVGQSGSGKTTAIAQLADAGYRILFINCDPNKGYTAFLRAARNLDNVYVHDISEQIKPDGSFPSGRPEGYNQMCNILDRWGVEKVNGEEVKFPSPLAFGNDTIIVVDSLTFLGDMIKLDVLAGMSDPASKKIKITDRRPQFAQWGEMATKANLIQYMLANRQSTTNVLCLTHIREADDFDAPREREVVGSGREKETVMVDGKSLFPSFIGKEAAKKLPAFYNNMWLVQKDELGKRTIKTRVMTSLGAKAEGSLPDEVPLDGGLATLFSKLQKAPVSLEPIESVIERAGQFGFASLDLSGITLS